LNAVAFRNVNKQKCGLFMVFNSLNISKCDCGHRTYSFKDR